MLDTGFWIGSLGVIGSLTITFEHLGVYRHPTNHHRSEQTEETTQFEPPNTGTISGSGTQKPGQSGSRTFNSDLIALVPASGRGITYSSRPNFWLYFAKAITSENNRLTVRLTIKDEATNGQTYAYREMFPLEKSPGFFRISVPSSVSPLEPKTEYNWEFLVFSTEDNQVFGKTEGTILRESFTAQIKEKLAQASPTEKAIFYGENGVWYELVDQLACLVSRHPDNPTFINGWRALMSDDDVRLAEIIEPDSSFLTTCESSE